MFRRKSKLSPKQNCHGKSLLQVHDRGYKLGAHPFQNRPFFNKMSPPEPNQNDPSKSVRTKCRKRKEPQPQLDFVIITITVISGS